MIGLPSLLRQRLAPQVLRRQPEMDIVMKDEEQDAEYSRDGDEGALAVVYDLIINTLLPRAPARGRALDVACGSGQLLGKLARSLPDIHFTGQDLSGHMLRLAEGNARRLGAGNVSFRSHDMYRLSELRDGPYDLVIWTLAAHHCLTTDDVVAVLNGIADVLVPGGAFFLFDLIRPKSGALAVRFADAYNRGQGSWFYHDSLDSYKAAFTFEEMGDALRRSRLRHAHHVQPAFGNFFQFAAIPAASPGGAQPVRHLRHLWQRRDYALLRFAFALSQWTQRP